MLSKPKASRVQYDFTLSSNARRQGSHSFVYTGSTFNKKGHPQTQLAVNVIRRSLYRELNINIS